MPGAPVERHRIEFDLYVARTAMFQMAEKGLSGYDIRMFAESRRPVKPIVGTTGSRNLQSGSVRAIRASRRSKAISGVISSMQKGSSQVFRWQGRHSAA